MPDKKLKIFLLNKIDFVNEKTPSAII